MPGFISEKAVVKFTVLTNIKAKEIDYFEMLIFLNIEENTQQFPCIFGNEPGQ